MFLLVIRQFQAWANQKKSKNQRTMKTKAQNKTSDFNNE